MNLLFDVLDAIPKPYAFVYPEKNRRVVCYNKGMAHQYFAGAVWTHHALERLSERKISQKMAGETFTHPDRMIHGKQAGTSEFIKEFGESTVTVIAKHNHKGEWIVVSCWIDPPLPGTKDHRKKEIYKQYKKAGFWGKIWLTLRQQIGY